MLKFFSKRMNNKKGFTLIELIVVIAILAILALIAIPRIGSFRTKAAISSHNANVRTLESAATMYLAEEGIPSDVITWDGGEETDDDTEWKDYIAAWPSIPKGARGQEASGGTGDENTIADNDKYEVTITPDASDKGKVTAVVTPGIIAGADD